MKKQTAGRTNLGDFAPKFAELNDDVLFGEVWSREDRLSARDRSLVTVTALMAQGLTDISFRHHLEMAKANGITRSEIAEILTHAAFYAGWPKAWAAFRLAKEVWTEPDADSARQAHQNAMVFPIGAPNDGFSQYFSGKSYLAPVSTEQVKVFNVTFEPGCCNNWHIHQAEKGGGQMLICVAGCGYYQEWGQKARVLHPGDVVNIAHGVKHWHGAAPDSWFSHLAVACNPATNENTWLEPVDDAQYAAATASVPAPASRLGEDARRRLAELFPGGIPELGDADPELFEIFGNFALGEVTAYGQLDTRTRMLCILASNIASQGRTAYRTTLEGALNAGVTPVEVKETLYQAVPYVGMAKVADFVGITNEVLEARGVTLPLAGQSTTSSADRFEKGLAVQRSIFGAERIDGMREAAPANQKHIQRYLSDNCFGDFLTRGGLDVKMRELLTFSMLVSLGGCESQVKGHIAGNANIGNDKATLLAVVTQLLPYIGYPRTLNGIACLNEVLPEK